MSAICYPGPQVVPKINGVEIPYLTSLDFHMRVNELASVELTMWATEGELVERATDLSTDTERIEFLLPTPTGTTLHILASDVWET